VIPSFGWVRENFIKQLTSRMYRSIMENGTRIKSIATWELMMSFRFKVMEISEIYIDDTKIIDLKLAMIFQIKQ
jgi:pyruvate formate-lyase activating enzyme-like uncharacterized protein